MAPLSTREYSEILKALESLNEYLTELGMRRAHDRLAALVANVREIEEMRRADLLPSLNTHPRVDELIWSMVEGSEFADIFHGIRDYDPVIVRKLMRRALKGPLHPTNETVRTTGARNTMFELMLGARFQRAGARPTLGREADILIDHEATHVYIEFKRPLFESSIAANIAKARHQFRRRFASDPCPSVGLVAVSVSKVLNPGSKWFIVERPSDLQQLTGELKRIHEVHNGDFNREIDPRLIGVVYHLYTPAYARDGGLYAASEFRIEITRSFAFADGASNVGRDSQAASAAMP